MTGVRLSDDWNDDGWTRHPKQIINAALASDAA